MYNLLAINELIVNTDNYGQSYPHTQTHAQVLLSVLVGGAGPEGTCPH